MASSIPGEPILDGQHDLTAPVQDLLKGLNLLGTDSKDAVSVIESNATNISKVIGSAVATLGGLSAVIGALGAFWNKQPNDVRMSLIITMGAVIAATVLALGWIITVDLRTRLEGQSKVYELRREFAFKFIDDGVQFQKPTPAPPAALEAVAAPTVAQPILSPLGEFIYRLAVAGSDMRVILPDETTGRLTGYDRKDGKLVVRVLDENNTIQWPSPDDLDIRHTVIPQQAAPLDAGGTEQEAEAPQKTR